MNEKPSEHQVDPILAALDEAISKGPWEQSNFLKVIGKNLRDIRDKYASQINLESDSAQNITNFIHNAPIKTGYQEVFIALYSSDGNNLLSWERLLASLPKQIISRPIYVNEADIIDVLRTKENKINEGYVSVLISENDILKTSADKTPVDKLGKPLLSLKNASVNLDNIKTFVHQFGTFSYSHGKLIKKPSAE